MAGEVFTLGHSTHAIAKFVDLLKRHRIEAIADVRSRPFSRMNPQFNRDALKRALRAERIRYAFVGEELGAHPSDPGCYVGGRARYDLIARTDLFRRGIERVLTGASKYRVALVCAEKDPMTCHRTMLVCRELIGHGLDARHILASGEIESQEDGLRRVASEIGVSLTDLFRKPEDILAEVYARRINEIEYVEVAPENESV